MQLTGPFPKPIAVITGACGGMGGAIARRLGARYRLALVDLSEEAVLARSGQLVDEGYDVALAAVADVADAESVAALVATVRESGTLGTLVHTAGLSPALAGWERIVDVNLVGTARILDAFLPLAGPGTSAICIGSVAAHTFPTTPQIDAVIDEPYATDLNHTLEPLLRPLDVEGTEYSFAVRAYGASKRGVLRMVERQVGRWAERGARIVSISPGTIVTPMGRKEIEVNPLAAAAADVTPLRRLGMATDIAAAVDFLSSDLASYITGCDLRVDGGIVAARAAAR